MPSALDENMYAKFSLQQALLMASSVALLMLLLLVTTGKAHAADFVAPAISIEGIHSPAVSFEGAELICTVRVENPNNEALVVTGGFVDLQLDGAQAASGRPLRSVSIPPRATRNVDLRVSLNSNAAFAWLPMFMGAETFTLPYRVIGYVDLDAHNTNRVPFDERGKVSMTSDGLVAVPAE
jgi:LEA14-like dessication related protein